MTERHQRHFQGELEQLKTRLLDMDGLAEDRLGDAMRALVDADARLVEEVITGDAAINALHIELDDRCFKLLALHQPMAVDLRAIVAAVKINTDLERVGDLAVNIAIGPSSPAMRNTISVTPTRIAMLPPEIAMT